MTKPPERKPQSRAGKVQEHHPSGISQPESRACRFLMGKQLLRPKMLLEKTVEALLTTATQPTVRVKKGVVQLEVSTLTSTVITRNTASMTKRDDRIRTLAATLGTREGGTAGLQTTTGKLNMG